jgi:copper ion binding protein
MTKKVLIDGMSCMHCVGRVKKVLDGISGVKEAYVNLEGKYALVESEAPVDDALIKAAIEDAGYEVKGIE